MKSVCRRFIQIKLRTSYQNKTDSYECVQHSAKLFSHRKNWFEARGVECWPGVSDNSPSSRYNRNGASRARRKKKPALIWTWSLLSNTHIDHSVIQTVTGCSGGTQQPPSQEGSVTTLSSRTMTFRFRTFRLKRNKLYKQEKSKPFLQIIRNIDTWWRILAAIKCHDI